MGQTALTFALSYNEPVYHIYCTAQGCYGKQRWWDDGAGSRTFLPQKLPMLILLYRTLVGCRFLMSLPKGRLASMECWPAMLVDLIDMSGWLLKLLWGHIDNASFSSFFIVYELEHHTLDGVTNPKYKLLHL